MSPLPRIDNPLGRSTRRGPAAEDRLPRRAPDRGATPSPRLTPRSVASGLAIVPSIALAALPKCPVCLMNVLGFVGLASVVGPEWLLPLTAVSLAGLLALFLASARRRGFGPLTIAAVASALLLLGWRYDDGGFARYAGMGLLVLASVWNNWPRPEPARAEECACAAAGQTRR